MTEAQKAELIDALAWRFIQIKHKYTLSSGLRAATFEVVPDWEKEKSRAQAENVFAVLDELGYDIGFKPTVQTGPVDPMTAPARNINYPQQPI